MGKFVQVISIEKIDANQPACVEIEGHELAIFEKDGDYYALDNLCTHQGGPLCEGEIEEGEVECPWHGARFDITSGSVTVPPASQDVKSYPVRVSNGTIEVELV